MLFRRRTPPRLSEKIRVWLWPRRNWKRSSRYISHRLRRLRATPHAIALGCATGVFASFTPFLGGHFVLAGVLAWLTRGSILFETKLPGDGVGLGLAISSGIVNDLGGRLTARNAPGGGAVFEMQLPILQQEPEETRAAE